MNFSLGYPMSKKYEIRAGINFQHFTRSIKSNDTLLNVNLYLDSNVNHRDHMYFASVNRKIEKRLNHLSFGVGLYYFRALQQTIEYGVGIPNFYIDQQAEFDEGGLLLNVHMNISFSPKRIWVSELNFIIRYQPVRQNQ